MLELSEPCPGDGCHGTIRFYLDDFASGRTARCTHGCDVELQDADGAAASVSKSLADVERSLKGLNGNKSFKL
jgi:hypothetical protein